MGQGVLGHSVTTAVGVGSGKEKAWRPQRHWGSPEDASAWCHSPRTWGGDRGAGRSVALRCVRLRFGSRSQSHADTRSALNRPQLCVLQSLRTALSEAVRTKTCSRPGAQLAPVGHQMKHVPSQHVRIAVSIRKLDPGEDSLARPLRGPGSPLPVVTGGPEMATPLLAVPSLDVPSGPSWPDVPPAGVDSSVRSA